MTTTFETFFGQATGVEPFPYQVRFATEPEIPELIHAPTGAGKTATAVLGWLWRYFHTDFATPRRLVYCLPTRVLVEQTREVVQSWISNEELGLADKVDVHVLMGGEEAEDWDLMPEKPTILIGTQDMLLSRVLNRGYGMSRFRWPIHFALLNNDCLWVLDEVQLMGIGLATSTQLQAFRESMGTFGDVKTVWMSATLLPNWLATIDYRHHVTPELKLKLLSLDPEKDYAADNLKPRWEAPKPIQFSGCVAEEREPKALARFIKENHVEGSITLVIVNTVDRGRSLFETLRELYAPPKAKGRKKNEPASESQCPVDLRLIHSRFRAKEREQWRQWLTQKIDDIKGEFPSGRIIVSTQVVEAGVDLSAQTLITELAPWPSLVQRFGRCNRRGEFTGNDSARVYWVDVSTNDDKKAAPYSKDELQAAREQLKNLTDVGLKSLDEFLNGLDQTARTELFPFDPIHVIRRKDLIDLFDTTPDLSGTDIDVSRFIRDGEEVDVHVFWRNEEPPQSNKGKRLTPAEARRLSPTRQELCPVKTSKDGGMKGFLEKKKRAFYWDALDAQWKLARPQNVYPGQVFWIPVKEGGYDLHLGWSPDSPCPPGFCDTPSTPSEDLSTLEPAYDTDLLSVFGWRSIAEHTEDVLEQLGTIVASLMINEPLAKLLKLAARWHDWGKAHSVFQSAIYDGDEHPRPPSRAGQRDIAKAAPSIFWRRYDRPHFRHELASALGVLTLINRGIAPKAWAELERSEQNLALYLIASHHGKVRLSIRSMPNERRPPGSDVMFASGIWETDGLPAVELGVDEHGIPVLSTTVESFDLSPMLLGETSWTSRMLTLRGDGRTRDDGPLPLGVFNLAFLEALLRAADMRASKLAEEKARKVAVQ